VKETGALNFNTKPGLMDFEKHVSGEKKKNKFAGRKGKISGENKRTEQTVSQMCGTRRRSNGKKAKDSSLVEGVRRAIR